MRATKIPSDKVQLIVYDFDGVMTDNTVLVREDGVETVRVNRSDGLAVGIIKRRNIPQVILSTEPNKVVRTRAKKLGIPTVQNLPDKKKALIALCAARGVALEGILYVGNDINDLEAMRCVGFPVCPADASREIKKVSVLTLTSVGGAGVVRELLDHLTGMRE